jgi:cytochrome bd-type quinol oxidase subunit 2
MGYVVVALSFALANVIGGRSPFYTAALLGAALFDGATDPAGVTVTAAPVAKYNLVHLLVFLGFGLLTAWLASMAERATQLWYVALFAFIFVGFHTIGAAQLFASPMEEAVSAPVVWVTGIVASIIMAGYVISKHPKLRRAERWDDASTQASGS